MARHLVRLKLRLLANRLRTGSVVGAIGFALVWVAAVAGGALGGLAVFGLGRLTGEPGVALVIAFTVTFIGWMVVPASFSALDETLDPRQFELLPLTSRQLVAGLLAAGAVGPGGVGTLVGLLVAVFASFPEWGLAPLSLVAVLLELSMCLVVARLVTSALSNLLASRRSREIVTLLFGLGFALLALLPGLLETSGDGPPIAIGLDSLDELSALGWLPPGALGLSIALASDGEILGAVGLLAFALAAVVAIGWGWARSVRRMMVTSPPVGRSGRRHQALERPLALIPGWLRLRPGPVTGTVAKELRYLVRDNRVRSQLLGSFIPLVVIAVISEGSFTRGEYTPFLAVGAAFLVVFGILANQFGVDGGSFWGYVVSPAPLTDIVKGKNLSWGLIVLAPALLIAVGMSFLSGQFAYLAAAMLTSLAVLLVAMSIGNMTSIYGAFRIPESNPFGNRGFSGTVFVAVILSMMSSAALLVPLALFVGLPALFIGPSAATIGALGGVGYGVLVYRLMMKLTSRLLLERRQQLLDVIDGERGS